MSEKKDRFDHRRYSRNHKWHGWANAPSSYKRWEKFSSRKFIRSRNRQLIREGRFDLLQPYHARLGWYW